MYFNKNNSTSHHTKSAIYAVLIVLIIMFFVYCKADDDQKKADPRYGGSATFHINNIISLNPNTEVYSDENIIHTQVFSRLVKLDRTLRLIPDVAREWTVKENGKLFIFKLDPGFKFHNGRRINSRDVLYTFEQACLSKSYIYQTYKNYLDAIDGVEQYSKGLTKKIAGISAPADDMVIIRLKEKMVPFLSLLSSAEFSIIPYPESKSPDFWRKPVGSGPFMVTEFTPRKRIILSRYPQYYPRPAFLDYIEISIGEVLSADDWNKKVGRMIDIAYDPPTEIEKILKNSHRSYYLKSLGQSIIFLNYKLAPFNNKSVRKAVAYALNRETFLEDHRFEPYGIFPSGYLGFRKKPNAYNHNPDKAKDLLRKAGFRRGDKELNINYYEYRGSTKGTAAKVKRYLEDIGFKVSAYFLLWDDFQEKAKNKSMQIFRETIDSSFPDPDDMLTALYHSEGIFNENNYKNPLVDRLIEEARGEFEQDSRAKLYHQLEDTILEDCAAFPLYEWSTIYYIHRDLKGFQEKRSELHIEFKDLYWEKKKH